MKITLLVSIIILSFFSCFCFKQNTVKDRSLKDIKIEIKATSLTTLFSLPFTPDIFHSFKVPEEKKFIITNDSIKKVILTCLSNNMVDTEQNWNLGIHVGIYISTNGKTDTFSIAHAEVYFKDGLWYRFRDETIFRILTNEYENR